MEACQGLLLAVARCVRQQQQAFVVVSTRDGYDKLVHLASYFRIRQIEVHHRTPQEVLVTVVCVSVPV